MHNGSAGGYKHPKSFVSYNGCEHDNIVSAIHLILSACHVLMSRVGSALGIRACRHCPTPVLENHRDDKAPDDKIAHVRIVIYCS